MRIIKLIPTKTTQNSVITLTFKRNINRSSGYIKPTVRKQRCTSLYVCTQMKQGYSVNNDKYYQDEETKRERNVFAENLIFHKVT